MKNIYICSPSSTFNQNIWPVDIATEKLNSLGFNVVLSKHALDNTGNTSSSIQNRVSDLIEGFTNDNYHIVMASVGGWNSNELLPHIPFQEFKEKIFIGMSDMTTLCVNLFQKSKVIPIYGSQFRHFINESDFSQFQSIVDNIDSFSGFYRNEIVRNDIFRAGNMSGRLVGGNLALLSWLLGTPYSLVINEGDILFIEDDEETNGYYWQMYLNHIKQAGYFKKISGLIIGKILEKTEFQENSGFHEILNNVIGEYKFPVLINADFGHIKNPISIPYGINYSIEI